MLLPLTAVKEEFHALPSVLYDKVELASWLPIVKVASLVTLSLELKPVSRSKLIVGFAMAVSKVNVKALPVALLPARSVCLTVTLLAPSLLMPVMVEPEPFVQLVPPFRLYCQVAPLSRPVTFSVLVLVILSVVLVPESVTKANPGASTAVS